MQVADRTQLRQFLKLGARSGNTVALRDIERQEDTVLRALALLETQPGVVLADEVGMGKTFEALGVVAAFTHSRANARTLILTPGPDLNRKWEKELRAFGDAQRPMYSGFRDRFASAWHLAEVVEKLLSNQVVVAPMTVFAGSRSDATRAYLLSAWAEHRGLRGNQVAAIFRQYNEGKLDRRDFKAERFLDVFDWKTVEPALAAALRAHQRLPSNLDRALAEERYEAFADKHTVDRLLNDIRVRLLGELVPSLDLLVVDEAHKLKNEQSVRTKSLRTMFEKRFDKALFLTATPFQLSTEELRGVFSLFSLAKSAPVTLEQRTARLMEDIQAYQAVYEELDRAWSMVDVAGADDFAQLFAADPALASEPPNESLAVVVAHARKLLRLKREVIEPGLRQWMIRSLREDKRTYRKTHLKRLRAEGGDGVPFLLYERFIAEMFRSKARTHKAAVQINMVSSFAAAKDGALLSEEAREGLPPSVEPYRALLHRIVSRDALTRQGHPKVRHVVSEALDAALRGEKTLIFCTRVATLRELKQEIEAQWDRHALALWQEVYPGIQLAEIYDQTRESDEEETRVPGRHSRIRNRFQGSHNVLYLALRERYVETMLRATEFASANLAAVVRQANAALKSIRVERRHAERFQWSLAKRCVEHAVAMLVADSAEQRDVDPESLARLCDREFIRLGYDLEADDLESSSVGDHEAQWSIDEADARLVLQPSHLWSTLTSLLMELSPTLRVRTVERFAGYLVSRYVPFVAELLAFANEQGLDVDNIDSRALLPVVDGFWRTHRGKKWVDTIRAFLVYAFDLDEQRRRDVLDDVVKAGVIVRHTVDGESREQLREAFNTPLYPMILIANEVMQEGLDLHHHCRRVIHHDLAWNPAQLEQRVGRVDRLGSLVQRRRAKDPTTTLDIELPLVVNTIDERLERTVRNRERWLEFLLGASPKIEEYGVADTPSLPLPERFAEALRIELGPRS
ncbi:MAG: helicase [Myxococcales bacterium]|nr:helicase [Myxococcales bacterium]